MIRLERNDVRMVRWMCNITLEDRISANLDPLYYKETRKTRKTGIIIGFSHILLEVCS